jgi:hypothetical protein
LKSQKNKRTEKVRYIPVELQACKFKTNGSTEGRIDVTIIVKSCKPASSKTNGEQRCFNLKQRICHCYKKERAKEERNK